MGYGSTNMNGNTDMKDKIIKYLFCFKVYL